MSLEREAPVNDIVFLNEFVVDIEKQTIQHAILSLYLVTLLKWLMSNERFWWTPQDLQDIGSYNLPIVLIRLLYYLYAFCCFDLLCGSGLYSKYFIDLTMPIVNTLVLFLFFLKKVYSLTFSIMWIMLCHIHSFYPVEVGTLQLIHLSHCILCV